MTGSFCTFSQVIDQMEQMAQQTGWQLYPILSPNAYETDTRFGSAQQFRRRIEEICGREIWHTLTQTEPIGPKKLLDVLLVAPCTGNTLGKLANGITDTNDALANAGKNIGSLLNSKNIYFVPMRQDAPEQKPCSIVADFSRLTDTVQSALSARQLQPLFC